MHRKLHLSVVSQTHSRGTGSIWSMTFFIQSVRVPAILFVQATRSLVHSITCSRLVARSANRMKPCFRRATKLPSFPEGWEGRPVETLLVRMIGILPTPATIAILAGLSTIGSRLDLAYFEPLPISLVCAVCQLVVRGKTARFVQANISHLP